MKMYSVISADLIGSVELSLKWRKQLSVEVEAVMEQVKKQKGRSSFERGDFIQIEVPANEGLKTLLLLKTQINKMGSSKMVRQENVAADIRISLGIGKVDLEGETVGRSDGPAYHLSGRGIDQLKKSKQVLAIQSSEEDFNEELKVMAASLEFITGKWTKGSAEIISLLISGKKEMEIAEELGISQSAVNQRKKTAGWDVISLMLERFESKTKNLK
ncbi:MAG: SatD family protein [Flavitalea sp.]